jgi:hypothetical protein
MYELWQVTHEIRYITGEMFCFLVDGAVLENSYITTEMFGFLVDGTVLGTMQWWAKLQL